MKKLICIVYFCVLSILGGHAQPQFYGYVFPGATCSIQDSIGILLVSGSGGGANCSDSIKYKIYFGDGNQDSSMQSVCDSAIGIGFLHVYSFAGNYRIQVVGIDSSGLSDTLIFPVKISDTCGNISGHIYCDYNQNCIYDAGDNSYIWPWAFVQIKDKKGFSGVNYAFMNDSGYYYFKVGVDTYEVSPSNFSKSAVVCPSSGYYEITDTVSTGNDFALLQTSAPDTGYLLTHICETEGLGNPVNKVRFHLVIRANSYYLRTCNDGSANFYQRVKLIYNSKLTYYNSFAVRSYLPEQEQIGTAPVFNNDTIVWDSVWSVPNKCMAIYVYFNAPPSVNLNDTLCFQAIVEPYYFDALQSRNNDTKCLIVGSPYDPNNKIVTPSGEGPNKIIPPSTDILTYTINFQNTGTATAVNVFILDTLDANNVDVSSLQIEGSSHPMQVQLYENKILKFDFPDIMLPDSGANEPASHGYLQYSIKLKSNLPIGTKIKNRAGIYFDFNPVVMTEYAMNTIDTTLTGINYPLSNTNYQSSISIYPNPAKKEILILYSNNEPSAINKQQDFGVFNLMGVLINEIKLFPDKPISINISKLEQGIYFLQSISDKQIPAKKLVIVKE